MDTNMTQALKLAGGILIALVLISGLTIMFGKLSPSQNTLEDIKAFEQTLKFNKEFEVYDKDIMYGVDVISAINKAASYNKAYIDEYGYTEDLKDNYLVDIEIVSNVTLQQNFSVTKLERRNDRLLEQTTTFGELNSESQNEIIDKLNRKVYIANTRDIINQLRTTNTFPNFTIGQNTNLITNNGDYIHDDIFEYIIAPSTKELKVTVQNTDTSDTTPEALATGVEQWYKATFEIYAYSFKTKRFRCVGTEYSDVTQRITKLVFTEI